MKTGVGRREARRQHAANRLFLEITLVMIFMLLLSYAPAPSQSTFSETAAKADMQRQGQSASGRKAWIRLDASGVLSLKDKSGRSRRGWAAIQDYLQQHSIGIVVIAPERNVPFTVLSSVWQRIVQSGQIVRISTN